MSTTTGGTTTSSSTGGGAQTCTAYCTAIMANCTDANKQYPDQATCEADCAHFPVGMATRTLFEKAEIVLWRIAPDSFHLEVWRSFAPYVWDLLDTVRKEEAAS